MGGTYSSPVPVALDELTQPYIVTPRLTRELYIQHLAGQLVDQDPDHPLLTHVPPELLGRVSLHKSLDLSFNLIEEIPQGLLIQIIPVEKSVAHECQLFRVTISICHILIHI